MRLITLHGIMSKHLKRPDIVNPLEAEIQNKIRIQLKWVVTQAATQAVTQW